MSQENSIFTILVFTDTHLGFKERDPIRKNDSFEAFEEILKFGSVLNVDFCIHAGDVFDQHKPSRHTLYKTMSLLRSYCLGCQRQTLFTILNKETRKHIFKFIHAQQEHPFIHVDMPIFAIHGNHDDPGGDSFLSAMDLLEVSSLVTYFGWTDNIDDIHVYPILFQKGNTKVALYGLGNIPDKRLYRAFQCGKVHFHEPEFGVRKEYFNLLIIHQNRFKGFFGGVTNTDHIPESMLPSFFDVVIWVSQWFLAKYHIWVQGHEHDTILGAIEYIQTGFHVIQPGSTLPTSLTPGEAAPKHFVILEIKGDSFRSTFVPLFTLRPFDISEIVLEKEEKGLLIANDMFQYLTQQVQVRIDRNERNWDDHLKHYITIIKETIFPFLHVENSVVENFIQWQKTRNILGIKQDSRNTPLPLIRLRIEHTGYDTIHSQRFGIQFIDQVANPDDLLIFFKNRKSGTIGHHPTQLPSLEIADFGDESGKTIQDLIFTLFDDGVGDLEILPEPELNIAVQHYVHKSEANAINEFVLSTLKKNQDNIKLNKSVLSIEDIRRAVHQKTEEARLSHHPLKDDQGVINDETNPVLSDDKTEDYFSSPIGHEIFDADSKGTGEDSSPCFVLRQGGKPDSTINSPRTEKGINSNDKLCTETSLNILMDFKNKYDQTLPSSPLPGRSPKPEKYVRNKGALKKTAPRQRNSYHENVLQKRHGTEQHRKQANAPTKKKVRKSSFELQKDAPEISAEDFKKGSKLTSFWSKMKPGSICQAVSTDHSIRSFEHDDNDDIDHLLDGLNLFTNNF